MTKINFVTKYVSFNDENNILSPNVPFLEIKIKFRHQSKYIIKKLGDEIIFRHYLYYFCHRKFSRYFFEGRLNFETFGDESISHQL